jgi:hypothetical protein
MENFKLPVITAPAKRRLEEREKHTRHHYQDYPSGPGPFFPHIRSPLFSNNYRGKNESSKTLSPYAILAHIIIEILIIFQGLQDYSGLCDISV